MTTNFLHINNLKNIEVMNAQLNLFGTEVMANLVKHEPQYSWEHEGLQDFKVRVWSIR